MSLKKITNSTHLLSSGVDNHTAKIRFELNLSVGIPDNNRLVCIYYYYENDDENSKYCLLKLKELVYTDLELSALETSLGEFSGATMVAKTNDMIEKIANNEINTSAYFGLSIADYIAN